MKSYSTSIEINCPINTVFHAICNDLDQWWGKQSKPIEKTGDEFIVSWGEPWYQFKVVKYAKNQEVIWECVDANQKINGLENVEKEWVGTKIQWRVKSLHKGRTLLELKHEGLIPQMLCFEFCSESWTYFLEQNLTTYLKEVQFSK